MANPVQVFCRLRPWKVHQGESSSIRLKDLSTVLLRSHLSSNGDQETHYTFKQVFDESSGQAVVFDVVARPLVERLLRGGNSLLFTYGITGSGKTYTMAGREDECGILPRCLKALFLAINGCRAPKGTFQTDYSNGFEIGGVETETKNCWENRKAPRSAVLRRKLSEIEFNLDSIGPIMPVSGIDEHHIYAVYVSYVEIYNNSVYDLLESDSQKAPQSHIVREDPNHNMYIHGATEVEVSSTQEAIEAFQIGQTRKRIGQTALNAESSRSHSVFNIRLVQAPSKKYAKTEENFITVSQLSLVDLAGSERSSRTKNTRERLREAGRINNSLMKLRECLEYLRENQLAFGNVTKKIPYRDSKLTYLFKNFFEGEGQVSMVVCINPNKDDHVENAQVLKFAEMTQEEQIVNTKPNSNGTQLKRPAWNKENAEPMNKENAQELDNDSGVQLELSQKKIKFLEGQNFALRLELTKLREAYETLSGRTWCNDVDQERRTSIHATVRKPLILRQKSNVSDSRLPLASRSLYARKDLQTAFHSELKGKLEKRRLKLEQSLANVEEKRAEDRSFLAEKSCIEDGSFLAKKSRIDEGIFPINKRNEKAEPPMNSVLKQKAEEEYKVPFSTPNSKKFKPNECIQIGVIAAFQMTPDTRRNAEAHSTHIKPHTPIAKGKLESCYHYLEPKLFKSLPRNTVFQRDVDFDKTEIDLSLKLEEHRNSRTHNSPMGKRKLDNILGNVEPKRSMSLPPDSVSPKDPDFDKKENDLSFKLQEHRRNRTANIRLRSILHRIRRTDNQPL